MVCLSSECRLTVLTAPDFIWEIYLLQLQVSLPTEPLLCCHKLPLSVRQLDWQVKKKWDLYFSIKKCKLKPLHWQLCFWRIFCCWICVQHLADNKVGGENTKESISIDSKIYINTYIYVYIYICIYIYIYIHTHIHIHMYIYMYIHSLCYVIKFILSYGRH